jgi:hypothetical protein
MSFTTLTDGELTAASIVSGIARWESLTPGESGELCFSGIRHHVSVGQNMQPSLSGECRKRLEEHMRLKLDTLCTG